MWLGARGGYKSNYGRIHLLDDDRDDYVHRVAYKLYHGEIPEGLTIDHVVDKGCRDQRCFRLEHLEAVTQIENNARRPRPTHCPHGHALTEDNVYIVKAKKNGRPYTSRRCRTCTLAAMKAQHARKRLAESLVH